MGSQIVLDPIDFNCIWAKTFFKIYVFCRRKKVIQVCNDRVKDG